MPYYTSPDGQLHFIDSAEYEHLLPVGSHQISEEDAKIIQNKRPGKPLPTTPEEIQQYFTELLQQYLDSTAQQRGYDGILSLCSYIGSNNPQFKAESVAGVAFRDAVWTYGYQVLADVQAGRREIPTQEEILSELPKIEWPEIAR